MTKRIAVIGAGCSGLAAIKCCLDDGLEPVCFEREDDIGGLWNYSENQKCGRGSVYKNCVINTSKEMMAFSDFPPPEQFPMFMPHRYVLEYFRLYAKKFDLLKHVRFSTSVVRIVKSDNYTKTGNWTVTYQTVGQSVHHEEYNGVLICTGHHTIPHQPDFSGLSLYRGTKLHSHGYKDNLNFHGKRVLIVGIGNSGVDIAVDVSHVASRVYLSTRRGAWVISRMGLFGLPADAVANNRFLFSLPQCVLAWGVEKMANFRFDHDSYGVKPKHGALQAHPTINDELPYRIMTGDIQVKPNVYHFTESKVQFDDGTSEEIDAVIFATGYEYKIGILDDSITTLDNNKTCLYKYMFPPDLPHPTLAVIGLVQAIGAIMPISEIQCRWFAQIVKGNASLPNKAEMYADIEQKEVTMARTYVNSQRHTLQCFWIEYMDEIAKQIGVKPNFVQLLREDPGLALRCMFGPCIPAQYRLRGPGKWDGARDAILTSMKRSLAPMKTRILPRNCDAGTKSCRFTVSIPTTFAPHIFFLLAIVLFLFTFML